MPAGGELHSFCVIPYFLRYQDWGLISRGLVGSALGLFKKYLTVHEVYVFITGLTFVLCVVTSCFVSFVYHNAKKSEGMIYLLLFFISNPAAVSFLFEYGNYGRFDIFMIYILFMFAFFYVKGDYVWATPFFCIVGNMIHQGFFFMYFPAILSMLLFRYLEERTKESAIHLVSTLFAGIISFLWLQFMGKIQGISYEEATAALSALTDYSFEGELMVKLEYFTPVLQFIPMYVLPALKKNLFKCFVVIILFFPAIALFGRIWRVCAAKNMRLLLVPLLPVIMIIPKFLITVDYGRDFAAVIIGEFVIALSIFASKDRNMSRAFDEWNDIFQKYKTEWLAYLLLMAGVGKFGAAIVLEFSDKILRIFFGGA